MHLLCLAVQADRALARTTSRSLEPFGLRAYHADTIKAALSAARQWRFDVVLLDADGYGERMPDMLAALRETRVPIVVVASAFDEETQLRRLEQGATAMVLKAESMRLTALRLRKVAEIRRQEMEDLPIEVRVGPLLIETRRARASVEGTPLELTSRQFEILLLLATRAGEFVHRQDFASSSRHAGDEASRSVDMHVSRLRAKLRQVARSGLAIYTVYGLGYCLAYKEEDSTVEAATALRA